MVLMLLFYVGEERYACSCDQIVEIIPQVPLKKIVQVQEYVSGALNYCGVPIPVVDFTQLCGKRPSVPYLSTRIIIFRRDKEGTAEQTLGLLAERVTDTIDRDPKEFVNSGFTLREDNYIGGVAQDTEGLIYHVLIDELFDAVQKVFSAT
jgi:chemotaxis-related protein WspB